MQLVIQGGGDSILAMRTTWKRFSWRFANFTAFSYVSQIFLTWQTGTLFLPFEQTTTQVWPGKDSEQ